MALQPLFYKWLEAIECLLIQYESGGRVQRDTAMGLIFL